MVVIFFSLTTCKKKNIPSPHLSNHNAPFSLVSQLVMWPGSMWKHCFHDTPLYMGPCEKPPHENQNLSAVFERFFQVLPSPVLVTHRGSGAVLGSKQLLLVPSPPGPPVWALSSLSGVSQSEETDRPSPSFPETSGTTRPSDLHRRNIVAYSIWKHLHWLLFIRQEVNNCSPVIQVYDCHLLITSVVYIRRCNLPTQ